MYRQAGTAAFIVATTLALPLRPRPRCVAQWNICSQPIITAGRASVQFGAGPSTGLDVAVVHLAMHDAIQAYDQRFEPYAGAITAGGGSPIAAAARAAHTVLLTKFPSLQTDIDTCYAASMAGVVLTPARTDRQRPRGKRRSGERPRFPKRRR